LSKKVIGVMRKRSRLYSLQYCYKLVINPLLVEIRLWNSKWLKILFR